MIDIKRLAEWEIKKEQHETINQLLDKSFNGYPKGKTFFRQQPAFRYLVYTEEMLIGQCGVESRAIYNNGGLRRIFGLSDFCIHPEHQNQGIGQQLISRVIADAAKTDYDYIISLTAEDGFYTSVGFEVHDTFCRWLILADDKSFGLVHRKLEDCLCVYPLKSDANWDPGFADFLGTLF